MNYYTSVKFSILLYLFRRWYLVIHLTNVTKYWIIFEKIFLILKKIFKFFFIYLIHKKFELNKLYNLHETDLIDNISQFKSCYQQNVLK